MNKAKNRRKTGKNEDVENIRGRELHHFLIQQMKELPAWQVHLNKLKEELVVQEDKWEHREEEKLELEKKRAEVEALEAEIERAKAQHRRESIEIVHEDKLNEEEQKRQIMMIAKLHELSNEMSREPSAERITSDEGLEPTGWSRGQSEHVLDSQLVQGTMHIEDGLNEEESQSKTDELDKEKTEEVESSSTLGTFNPINEHQSQL